MDGLARYRIVFKLLTVLRFEASLKGQKEISDIVGTSQSAISRALNGGHIKIDTLVRWLKKLDYEVDFYLGN